VVGGLFGVVGAAVLQEVVQLSSRAERGIGLGRPLRLRRQRRRRSIVPPGCPALCALFLACAACLPLRNALLLLRTLTS
jgi:hypothetical protein